jgi:hypothetical protein
MVDHDCPSEIRKLQFKAAYVVAPAEGEDGVSKALSVLFSAQRSARAAAGSLAA